MSASATDADLELIRDIVQRVVDDLAMITDREFVVEDVSALRDDKKVAGKSKIHISFRLGFHLDGQVLHGCILLPLPAAISLACYLMMVPDEDVKARRGSTELDRGSKDAMLEIGNFIGGATDAAVRNLLNGEVSVRSEGCQGVQADSVPIFVYQRGTPIVVGEASLKLHSFPAFKMIVQLPVLTRDEE